MIQRVILVALGWISILSPNQAYASACCARSSASPSLILGEDKAQFNLGFSSANVVATADEGGAALFGSSDVSQTIQVFRMDGAILLSDRFQMGVTAAFQRQSMTETLTKESSLGLGDTRISLGYEFLPLWTYSRWKPQGFLYSVLTVPTGRSTYEQQKGGATDVLGNGFFSLSVGTLFLKRIDLWDFFIVPEIHYSFSRTFQTVTGNSLLVQPGWGGSFGFGAGYSPEGTKLRLGMRIQPRIDQPRKIYAQDSSDKNPVGNCDLGMDLSYLLGSSSTLMLSYTDQTLLGPAMNSPLSRVLALNFQHRWER